MTATLSTHRPIRQLPVELANQIAAGEVVERPASVVKELVENSLDAGATRIEVSISHGGLQAITVRDNGWGIPREQLPLAISRHATSKIISLEELENILSLGFRGEALASIGSVSRMQLVSCCADQQAAWQIDCDSDELTVQAAAHPTGTSIIVQDLFYNTPGRRKFMRSEKTEFHHIDEVLRRLALSRFEVGFSFKHNDRLVYQFAPAESESSRTRRVARLCGKAFMDHALLVDFDVHGMRLWGWLTGPAFSRSQNDMQHFYVNGRVIRDRLISHAIRQVYQDWIHPGRHAAYLLHLELDPSMVDVNVHPTKHEVRFREARMVHDFIHRSLREALAGQGRPFETGEGEPWRPHSYAPAGYAPPTVAEQALDHEWPLGHARLLLHNRFIVAENHQGLVLVDAREGRRQLIVRQLSGSLTAGNIDSRPLLIPRSIAVSAGQVRQVEQSQALFKRLGFDLNANGPESVLLRMIPVALAGADLPRLLATLLSNVSEQSDRVEDEAGEGGLLQGLAEVAAETQDLESSPEALNRTLRAIEALQDSRLWRGFSEHELRQLIHAK